MLIGGLATAGAEDMARHEGEAAAQVGLLRAQLSGRDGRTVGHHGSPGVVPVLGSPAAPKLRREIISVLRGRDDDPLDVLEALAGRDFKVEEIKAQLSEMEADGDVIEIDGIYILT